MHCQATRSRNRAARASIHPEVLVDTVLLPSSSTPPLAPVTPPTYFPKLHVHYPMMGPNNWYSLTDSLRHSVLSHEPT